MGKSPFTEKQIIGMIKEQKAGMAAPKVATSGLFEKWRDCRTHH